ncbi:deoxyribonuclease V [Pleurocapsales cyanobacterium LEGE 10410]|nr:deoxyribonuclease V [Pleurocapsales cyanobacterium LEGE 10410]
MQINSIHPWVKSVAEAKEIQQQLSNKVVASDCLGEVKYVAGVDIGFEDNYAISKAAVAVLSYPKLELVETAIARIPTAFPYVPGYLSFREIPAILAALPQLKITPDLILCDGQGLAHPRRLGLACHLGVLLDLPTIGVAKSLLIGKHEEVPLEKGNWQPLLDKDETIGVVLRSRTKVKPIYVSIGHKISLPTAIDYVMGCLTKYRLPETTRWADKLASSKK